jgi:hypothetical protein
MILENKVALYVLAGVATSPNFMKEFVYQLKASYAAVGYEVQTHILFPYGDWSCSLVKQLYEITHDLFPKPGRNLNRQRGQKVADYIISTYDGGQVVMVGHSSGGVAAVHAAEILELRLIPTTRVVQIGSPKCPVSPKHRSSTLYIRAVNLNGKSSDPVTRIGSWGGWERSGRRIRWNPRLAAPDHIVDVPIVGGHADYFRDQSAFTDDHDSTNLDKMRRLIWQWLHPEWV